VEDFEWCFRRQNLLIFPWIA